MKQLKNLWASVTQHSIDEKHEKDLICQTCSSEPVKI